MSKTPSDLKYSKTHEWVKVEDGNAKVGITDHAQDNLGDITFVELPKIGAQVKKDAEVSVIESVKAASDLYSPVTGEIVSVNSELENAPEIINSDPYGKGWLYTVKISDKSEIDALMDALSYEKYLETI
ncbi:MAG: glycine cleavage system protein GcvH [Chitinispirillales bacterium]|jgi:glycine cleavage system H protein|nr:glycine cleavage system protein GcvH [Chitinispirillales bacterium]